MHTHHQGRHKESATMAEPPTKKQKNTTENNSGEPEIKFRNYVPSTEDLKAAVLPEPELPSIEAEVMTQQAGIQEAEQERRAAEDTKNKDVDLMNLAPQKIDWDLKRDIAPKLAKLDKRTKKAIDLIVLSKLNNSK